MCCNGDRENIPNLRGEVKFSSQGYKEQGKQEKDIKGCYRNRVRNNKSNYFSLSPLCVLVNTLGTFQRIFSVNKDQIKCSPS